MLQASDRRAADEALEKLDQAMQERNGWQVQASEVEGQSVTRWTSPFASLNITRGWMEGDVMFLALESGNGSRVAEAVLPTPSTSLVNNDRFRAATTTDLKPHSGNFFLAIDQLANPDLSFPVPALSTANQDVLQAMQAIGLTTAVQDNRTTRHDARILLQRASAAPSALPAPGTATTQPTDNNADEPAEAAE
jgi:hypothetical protein